MPQRLLDIFAILAMQYRLRIGDIRAFYDVEHVGEGGVVEVIAIREKSETVSWLAEHGETQDDPSAAE